MNAKRYNFARACKKEESKTYNELYKQWYILNGCACIVLWELYGWRKKRIVDFACHGGEVWKQVAEAGPALSTLELLEAETGIELTLDGYPSYHEFSYLDHTKWDGHMPTIPEQIYILQQQRVWLPTMLLAGFCTALHRKEGWGLERLTRFVDAVTGIRKEQHDVEYFKKLCKERYDIELLIL